MDTFTTYPPKEIERTVKEFKSTALESIKSLITTIGKLDTDGVNQFSRRLKRLSKSLSVFTFFLIIMNYAL